MGGAASQQPTFVPAFVLCDGHFALEGGELAAQLESWCGWLRFEGHGGVIVRRREESVAELRGTWRVVGDGETVCLELTAAPGEAARPPLLLREGPAEGSIRLAIEGVRGDCVATFVPEEDGEQNPVMAHVR